MKCRHLVISEEAYRNGEPFPAFLCSWPDRKLGVTPDWVQRRIGGGNMVDHATECADCPCFEKQVTEMEGEG